MTKTFACAMRLLCRREHGAQELAEKLKQKGYPASEVSDAIAECQRLGYQSDVRFVELFVRHRIQQGCGPLRINQELKAKKVDPLLVEQVLAEENENWLQYALAVWQKKYRSQEDISWSELQKRQRFLQYRGFSSELINQIFAELNIKVF